MDMKAIRGIAITFDANLSAKYVMTFIDIFIPYGDISMFVSTAKVDMFWNSSIVEHFFSREKLPKWPLKPVVSTSFLEKIIRFQGMCGSLEDLFKFYVDATYFRLLSLSLHHWLTLANTMWLSKRQQLLKSWRSLVEHRMELMKAKFMLSLDDAEEDYFLWVSYI